MNENKKDPDIVQHLFDEEISSDVEEQTTPEEMEKGEDVLEKAGVQEEELDLESLKKELEEIRLKSDEYLDGWQRALAEFANFKKRVERERGQMHTATTAAIIRRYLDVVDDLERALANQPQNDEGAEWAKGIELIYRKLVSTLEAEGVKPMEAQGQPFDPNLHEAISHDEDQDYDSGQVIEVIKTGYLIGDRVLRPALVRVAK